MLLADEIVVVRAIGAQAADDTVKALEEFAQRTALPLIVGEYRNRKEHGDWPHVDDFAAARNQAWELATGEWIMWADTDDRISRESCEVIRWMLSTKGDSFDMLRMPYTIPSQGISQLRERIVRRGIGRWMHRVHECLEPVEAGKTWRVGDLEAEVVHDPGPRPPAGRNGRNLRILKSVPAEEMDTSLRYHLWSENFALGNDEDGIRAAMEFLEDANAGSAERYEAMLTLANYGTPEEKEQWLHLAYHECPDRREALAGLCAHALAVGKPDRGLSYARAMLALPMPAEQSWNLRRKFWGWAGEHEHGRAMRAAGFVQRADVDEMNRFLRAGAKISLLHATRGRALKAMEARIRWLDLAAEPDAVEHIFALDADDEQGPLLCTFRHIVQKSGGPVGAWNLAARISHGKVLVQMSDDFVPPLHWDRILWERLSGAVEENVEGVSEDWWKEEKVLRVSDGNRTDGLLVLGIVTRGWYARRGVLFHPRFFSMFSDNWLTMEADRAGAIVEAKDVVFEHLHPAFGKAEMDATYARSNALLHYATGQMVLKQLMAGDEVFTWEDIPGLSGDGSPVTVHELVMGRERPGAICVEVGVARGRGLACMATLAAFRGHQVLGVDHFKGTSGEGIEYPEKMRDECVENLRRCGLRVYLIPLPSVVAAGHFNEMLDYVFLDAAHDYESVRTDIDAWWRKIRPGGWMGGHDYTHSAEVRRAVHERFLEVEQIGECWLVQKPAAEI